MAGKEAANSKRREGGVEVVANPAVRNLDGTCSTNNQLLLCSTGTSEAEDDVEGGVDMINSSVRLKFFFLLYAHKIFQSPSKQSKAIH